jgi:hypothetical protein
MTFRASEVKGSPSMLNKSEKITLRLSVNWSPSREEHSHDLHMTSIASMMEGSPSTLKKTSQHESQLSKPDLEYRLELQLPTTQSRPPHDLQSKHDGGE